jgi:hypothetical protein
MASPFSGILKKFSRRRPVKTFTHETGNEATFDELTLEDKVIHDDLKNRAFIVSEKSKYITFNKDVKAGRYEYFECSAEAGATVARVKKTADGSEQAIDIFGPLTVKVSECLHYIITSAEDVYNIEDTNLLMKLLKVKMDFWQLLIIAASAFVIGFLLSRAF